MTEPEQKIISDIDTYGWHVINVLPEGYHPSHSFSIGLYRTFKHPEVVIFGLKASTAHVFINNIGQDIKDGMIFEAGGEYPDLATGYPVTFVEVPASRYSQHLGWALWFYGEKSFPVLQMVWPDRSGNFPWHACFDPELHSLQPILGDVE